MEGGEIVNKWERETDSDRIGIILAIRHGVENGISKSEKLLSNGVKIKIDRNDKNNY